MKKLTLIFCIILTLLVFSCDNKKKSNSTELENSYNATYGIQTIEHEGCEYLIYKDRSGGNVQMLHKQNCKYCIQTLTDK